MALTFCLVAACGADLEAGGDAATQVFSPAALREDLAFLEQAHAQRHPRRYQVPASDALQQAFATAHIGLDRPMTRAQAFRHIARVNPAFRDAHTLVMPLLGEVDADDPTQTRFPLSVRLDEHGLLRVRGDWQRAQDDRVIHDGAVLTHLNGVPVDTVLDRLAAFGHGETPLLQRRMLGLMFRHWLHAVEGWQGDITVGLVAHGEATELSLRGADTWESSGPAASDMPSIEFLSDQVAVLRLPTFDVDEESEIYAGHINEAFARLNERRPQGLIIDARGNTGGQSDAGAQVIRRLIDEPVSLGARARERLNEDNNGLFGYRGQPGSLVEMDVSRDGRVDPAPHDERFRGRVVLLVDAMTYSAAILFATTLQDHGLATLIGQPTGGFGNQTGNMEPVVLPNTGLLAYIPAREFVRPNGDPREAPVMPDIVVEPGAADAIEGDTVLRCAVAFIEQAERARDALSMPSVCQQQ